MKKRKVPLCVVLILSVAFLVGLYITASHNNSVRVAIMPGTDYHVLFSITTKNTIDVSLLNIPVVNIKNDDFTDKVIETQTINLSETDSKEIRSLIKALKKSDNYTNTHPLISIGGDEVQACVNNKLYRSMYQSDYSELNLENINTALLDLSYKLIELSPIDIYP